MLFTFYMLVLCVDSSWSNSTHSSSIMPLDASPYADRESYSCVLKWLVGGTRQASLRHKGSLNPHHPRCQKTGLLPSSQYQKRDHTALKHTYIHTLLMQTLGSSGCLEKGCMHALLIKTLGWLEEIVIEVWLSVWEEQICGLLLKSGNKLPSVWPDEVGRYSAV